MRTLVCQTIISLHLPHAGLLRSLRSLVKLLLDVAPIGRSTLIESSR